MFSFPCHKITPFLDSGGSRVFGGGAPTAKVGVLTYYFAIFLPKIAWKWKNLDPVRGAPLDRPTDSWMEPQPPPAKWQNLKFLTRASCSLHRGFFYERPNRAVFADNNVDMCDRSGDSFGEVRVRFGCDRDGSGVTVMVRVTYSAPQLMKQMNHISGHGPFQPQQQIYENISWEKTHRLRYHDRL